MISIKMLVVFCFCQRGKSMTESCLLGRKRAGKIRKKTKEKRERERERDERKKEKKRKKE
jgi:hypothetical protein